MEVFAEGITSLAREGVGEGVGLVPVLPSRVAPC